MEKQVEKEHYNFLDYVSQNRWNSYYKQVEEILKGKNENVLVIGAGDKIVPNILKTQIKEVKVFDIAEDLFPDYRGDILEIDKVLDKKFDSILCCQVLEHLPFSEFEICIEKLEKVINKKLILSLPQQYTQFFVSFKLPKIPKLSLKVSIPKMYKKFSFNGEHYWELGTKGYSVRKIRNILKKYFNLEKEYVQIENTYHRFFILTKKGKINE